MLRPSLLLLTLALVAVTIGACGDDASTTTADPGAVATPEYQEFRSQPTACGASAPAPAVAMQFDSPGDAGVSGPIQVTIHTSCGAITLELDPALAPETVNSFVFLARQGYFDGTVAHRFVPGFVFQAGDPTATGMGSPGYNLPDEFPAADFSYVQGTVAMAKSTLPNSAGSQFFIALEDIALPPQYTVFGRVLDGFDALASMARVPLEMGSDGNLSRPLETIYLESVEVLGG